MRSGAAKAFAGLLALSACASCQAEDTGLAVRWELTGNTPKTSAVFTIKNKSGAALPASGWRLYFTSVMGIDPAGVGGGFKVEHINGDLYRLFPGDTFKGLQPGADLRISYESEGPLLNYSAAPAGLYLVRDQAPDKGEPVGDYTVAPVKDPSADFIKPADIYAANALVKDIPAAELPAIFPTPASYKALKGSFMLHRHAGIYAEAAFSAEAAYLAGELTALSGTRPRMVPDGAADIVIKKGPMADEAYELSVTTGGIVIIAAGPAGAFYAIQSLKSLMPPASWAGPRPDITLPALEVRDAPRFAFRGLLLDVARNFKKKDEVLKVLDLMALYKLNVLHFHISDDEGWRFEVPGLPELTGVGARRGHGDGMLPPSFGAGPLPDTNLASGYYTRAEFMDILRYAAKRHIEVMPELESPGHARAAIKAMEARYARLKAAGDEKAAEEYLLSDPEDKSVYRTAQYWNDNVMCVALPSVYRFEAKVLDELVSIYREAGAPLRTVHMGGDEVPAGAWEASPAVKALMARDHTVRNTEDLWHYYYSRTAALLKERGLFLSGWEEAGLRKTEKDGKKSTEPAPDFAAEGFRVHVWSNMAGWGNEDLPYRLANAGYKVVLSCVGNNYFDLAYSRSPDEPGYYWGGFTDVDKPFSFLPYDYYRNARDVNGKMAGASVFEGKERLTEKGRADIAGLQGLLWGENITSNGALEYMLLPKLLGLAERAWAPDPAWAVEKDTKAAGALYDRAWSIFVNTLGKRELPRLDSYHGGFSYRIPPVGAITENGKVLANVQLPGFDLRYTSDGAEPTAQSRLYTGPIAGKGLIKIKAFTRQGRGGKTTRIENY